MAQPSALADTPKPDLSVLVEFPEAYFYMQPLLCQLDPSPEFTDGVLRLVVKEVLDYANKWITSTSLDDAVCAVLHAGGGEDLAYGVVKNAHDVVTAKMAILLPDFSVAKYAGKYRFQFLGGPYGRIRFDYWHAGAPGANAEQPSSPQIGG